MYIKLAQLLHFRRVIYPQTKKFLINRLKRSLKLDSSDRFVRQKDGVKEKCITICAIGFSDNVSLQKSIDGHSIEGEN